MIRILEQPAMNKLFFNDNLNILREHISDESVNLIYLEHIATKRRSTYSPGCSEVKPWVCGWVDWAM